jgi:hypothetical protein
LTQRPRAQEKADLADRNQKLAEDGAAASKAAEEAPQEKSGVVHPA